MNVDSTLLLSYREERLRGKRAAFVYFYETSVFYLLINYKLMSNFYKSLSFNNLKQTNIMESSQSVNQTVGRVSLVDFWA